MEKHIYIAIDLKSFYASVECVDRGLDPLTTNLVVADPSRTEQTICLAISPSLKEYGLGGRARLFEVNQKVKEINQDRKKTIYNREFQGRSYYKQELHDHPEYELDFIIAPPRMQHYVEYSTKVHQVYLKYIAKEDIHVYSIDEVFMDVTSYLHTYHTTPRELAMKIILDILETTGITATAGIGTNLYLCKVAMDIVAKHLPADENGVRIACLDEKRYRQYLWNHQPITDFWRVGRGYAKRLEKLGLYTMGDIAKCSAGNIHDYYNEDLLYKEFGVNAELLIDHAWGVEPCSIKDIKNYIPQNNCLAAGQVLYCGYSKDAARIILKEMLSSLALDLFSKHLICKSLTITIGYDKDQEHYEGELVTDRYGRNIPKHTHGTVHLGRICASEKLFMEKGTEWYDLHVSDQLKIRRLSVNAIQVVDENHEQKEYFEQLNLFEDPKKKIQESKKQKDCLDREKKLLEATLKIKQRYGKNALIRLMDLEEGATIRERNNQIGGHRA